MRIDRYSKIVLTVIALALTVLALNPWLGTGAGPTVLAPRAVDAQTEAKYVVTIPKAWGKLVGFSDGNVLLEAPDGTLRDVDLRGNPPEYPKVKAMVRWQ
jgi:hypothetical protein